MSPSLDASNFWIVHRLLAIDWDRRTGYVDVLSLSKTDPFSGFSLSVGLTSCWRLHRTRERW